MGAKIYQLPTALAGTVNVSPNFKYMVSGDNLATVTAAGYLNQIDLQSNPIAVNDIIQMLYDYDLQTQVGNYNAFSVTIDNGIITLSAEISRGNVIFPVVPGHVAQFSGSEGAISDAGFSAANTAFSPSLPVVVGDVVTYLTTDGQLQDSGVLIGNLVNRSTYNAFNLNAGLFFNTALYTAPSGAVSVISQSGIITTDSLTTASGSTYSITITPSFSLIHGSPIFFQLKSDGTNTAGNNIVFTYNVTGAVQPINLTILNSNVGALNGTLVFAYFIAR